MHGNAVPRLVAQIYMPPFALPYTCPWFVYTDYPSVSNYTPPSPSADDFTRLTPSPSPHTQTRFSARGCKLQVNGQLQVRSTFAFEYVDRHGIFWVTIEAYQVQW